MTTWIGTNQTGWDANSIGFHSIQGCTGLVLRTDHWIAGWHVGGGGGGNYLYSGQTKIAFQGAAFLAYIQAINPHPWPAVGMLGGTVALWNIHNGHGDWKTELADFAAIIGYQGPTHGFDLRSKVGATESCDVVVTMDGAGCRIEYKRTRKMDHTPQDATQMAASPVMTLFGTPTRAPGTQPIINAESASAGVVPTSSNRGRMHIAASRSLARHDV
jgi:hypothetical protein